jgi:hypothetical protein
MWDFLLGANVAPRTNQYLEEKSIILNEVTRHSNGKNVKNFNESKVEENFDINQRFIRKVQTW